MKTENELRKYYPHLSQLTYSELLKRHYDDLHIREEFAILERIKARNARERTRRATVKG